MELRSTVHDYIILLCTPLLLCNSVEEKRLVNY